MSDRPLYGLLAEFADAGQLVAAVGRARAWAKESTREATSEMAVEAYAPFPIAELTEALGPQPERVPLFMLLGAIVGGAGTYALEWYSAVLDYPLNIGGRPFASWPAFIPPAVEITLLAAAVAGVIAMLIGNGLPRLHHPLFAIRAFERASSDRFFLVLRAQGADFEPGAARQFLATLAPLTITEVPA